MSLKSLINLLSVLFFLWGAFIHAHPEFTLEHARTVEERTWGLMGRATLPENQGLLIHYPTKEKIQLWMFNCYFDLSVAFIDENHRIQELQELSAFPEKMDPLRPVKNLSDLKSYPYSDPISQFFRNKRSESHLPAAYALEMNKGWFQKNGIKVDDIVYWDLNKGYIVRQDSQE